MNKIVMKKLLKKACEDNAVVDVHFYDGGGYAEILEYNEQEDEVTLQWITFCPCYDCQVYDESLYTEPDKRSLEYLAEVKLAPISYDERVKRRTESIEYDAPIFERCRKLEESQKEKTLYE